MDTNYTIKYGDTLGALASKYGTDVNSLAKANNITDVNKISAGSVLKIPGQTPVANTITPQSLAPVTPVTVPTYNPPAPTVQAPAVVQSIGNQDLTQNQQQETNLTKIISDATAKLTGQAQELATQKDLAGVNTLNKQLTDTNNEILAKQADLNKNDIQLISDMRAIEGKDTLLPFAQEGQAKLQGDAQIARALKSSEIGVLNARAMGLQGNIQLANKTAEDAVKLKYAPYQDMIDVAKAQLEAITPLLNREEKLQAEERAFLYDKKSREIASRIELDTYRAKKGIDNAIIASGNDFHIPTTTSSYTVTDSDLSNGLENIADSAGVTVDEILKLNPSLQKNANGNYLLRKNQTLTLPVALSSDISQEEALKNATTIVLGSSKFSDAQKRDFILAVKTGQDPLTVLKNKAKEIMGSTLSNELSGYERAQSTMKDISSQIKEYYANSGKTSLLSGKYENVINNLGSVNDPKLVELAVQIATNLQLYRKAVTGTAYSVQEGQDIASVFPGINKSQGLNEAIIKGRTKAFDSMIDGTYGDTLGEPYQQLKGFYAKNEVPDPIEALNDFANANIANANLLKAIYSSQPDASGLEIYNYMKSKGYIQ